MHPVYMWRGCIPWRSTCPTSSSESEPRFVQLEPVPLQEAPPSALYPLLRDVQTVLNLEHDPLQLDIALPSSPGEERCPLEEEQAFHGNNFLGTQGSIERHGCYGAGQEDGMGACSIVKDLPLLQEMGDRTGARVVASEPG